MAMFYKYQTFEVILFTFSGINIIENRLLKSFYLRNIWKRLFSIVTKIALTSLINLKP